MSPYLKRPCRTEAQALKEAKRFWRRQAKQNKDFRQARMRARNWANTPWDKPA